MYFDTKSYLKNTSNHTIKHALTMTFVAVGVVVICDCYNNNNNNILC